MTGAFALLLLTGVAQAATCRDKAGFDKWLDDIRRVHELVQLPIFCIGGIKLENLPRVLAAGAKRAVIVSGLLQSPDVAAATRAAKQLFIQSEIRIPK